MLHEVCSLSPHGTCKQPARWFNHSLYISSTEKQTNPLSPNLLPRYQKQETTSNNIIVSEVKCNLILSSHCKIFWAPKLLFIMQKQRVDLKIHCTHPFTRENLSDVIENLIPISWFCNWMHCILLFSYLSLIDCHSDSSEMCRLQSLPISFIISKCL